MAQLALIAAVARNGVIGRDNQLPWRLPDELKHFKALTLGHPIVMGRKTWESLGRPLPGRDNVVITRQRDYAADGAIVVDSLTEARQRYAEAELVFVIGGGELYAQALPYADVLYLTEVMVEVAGDTRFPALPADTWHEVSRSHHPCDERHAHAFDFVEYRREAVRP